MLGESSRHVVVLYYMSEWSIKEIAFFLNLSEKAVESRLRRGRNFLKKELANEFFATIRQHQLGAEFQERVIEHLIRRMGCIYIPVTDRFRTIEWFVRHFGIMISSNGNPMLPSGETLFFLESSTLSKRPRSGDEPPIIAFTVEDTAQLHRLLQAEGVHTGELRAAKGHHYFKVLDPDRNAFILCKKNISDLVTHFET